MFIQTLKLRKFWTIQLQDSTETTMHNSRDLSWPDFLETEAHLVYQT
jgi:hypothetical protein